MKKTKENRFQIIATHPRKLVLENGPGAALLVRANLVIDWGWTGRGGEGGGNGVVVVFVCPWESGD